MVDFKRLQRIKQINERGMPVFSWVQLVAEKYKERGVFPISLCDYYTEKNDKEIAATVDLMIPHTNKRPLYVMEIKNILGEYLTDMVKERAYVSFADGPSILKTSSLTRSVLYNILDWVWENSIDTGIPLEHIMKGESGMVKIAHKRRLSDVLSINEQEYRLRLLMAKMSLSDGYGCGLWNISKSKLKYPISKRTNAILKAIYPVSKTNAKETIHTIGFKNEIDFLYAEWGYEKMCQIIPNEISRFERLYPKRLQNMSTYNFKNGDYKIKELLPKITFDSDGL